MNTQNVRRVGGACGCRVSALVMADVRACSAVMSRAPARRSSVMGSCAKCRAPMGSEAFCAQCGTAVSGTARPLLSAAELEAASEAQLKALQDLLSNEFVRRAMAATPEGDDPIVVVSCWLKLGKADHGMPSCFPIRFLPPSSSSRVTQSYLSAGGNGAHRGHAHARLADARPQPQHGPARQSAHHGLARF